MDRSGAERMCAKNDRSKKNFVSFVFLISHICAHFINVLEL